MRICHVVENLNRGGLERVVVNLVKQQSADGHLCKVVSLFEMGELARELSGLEITVRACHKSNGFDFGALRSLRHELVEVPFDVIHTHNPMCQYYAALALCASSVGCFLNTRHGMGAIHGKWRLREILYRISRRRTHVSVAVAVIALQQFIKDRVFIKKRSACVPNGIELQPFLEEPKESIDSIRLELGLSPSTWVIGTVGRLNWAKDHRTLLVAFKEILATNASIELVIVGGGPLYSELTEQAVSLGIDHKTHIVGPRNDVPRLLRVFDAFVLPSLTEGYSLSLLEACAAGLPIVTTRVGGNEEIISDGKTGFIINPNKPLELAAQILRLFENEKVSTRLGQAAREWALANASVRAMTDKYYRIYQGEI